MNSIRYCIDNVYKSNSNITIEGWAYSEKNKNVSINIKNVEIIQLEEVERVDIFHAYHQRKEALKSGFKVKIPYTKKVEMVFTTDDEKLSIKFSTRGNPKPQRISKFKVFLLRLWSIINPYRLVRFAKYLFNNGLGKTIKKIRAKFKKVTLNGINYDDWFRRNLITPKGMELQRKYEFENKPKISLVMSSCIDSGKHIDEMIKSVKNQTYTNWELIISAGMIKDEKIISKIEKFSEEKIKILYSSIDFNESLDEAQGDYIGFIKSSDMLTEDALFEVVKVLNDCSNIDFIYSDEDEINKDGSRYFEPKFKPDWSPDTMKSYNYIGHLTICKKELIKIVGKFNNDYKESREYDIYLRVLEKAEKIYHIAKVLYHKRQIEEKEENYDKVVLSEHLKRIKEDAYVENGLVKGSYKINYKINNNPKVSIIIPNKDETETLKTCINSILQKSTYKNYEIIIVENNSESDEVFKYYNEISKIENIKIIEWKREFNYSAINNFAFKETTGEFIVLLNNDIEVISENWLEEMLMQAQRKEVGIVGAKLYYPDNSIQHAGVVLGIGGVAGHSHSNFKREEVGFNNRLMITQNVSAVTAACLMIRRGVYKEVKGLNENLAVAFNDIDFCLKVREKGYLIIFSPYIEMYHYESKSRGQDDTKEKSKRFESEIKAFHKNWGLWIRDPYYNENLTLDREDFSLRI